MTLILSVITPHFVAHVSDRRLSVRAGSQIVACDDDTNKLVVFANRMVFGYTGMAFIDPKQSEPTDKWLTRRLSELPTKSIPDAINAVRDQATTAFQKLDWPASMKHHAFVGVGWQEQHDNSTLVPVIVRISNFHDEEGHAHLDARPQFSVHTQIYREPSVAWWHNGAIVTRQERADLHKFLTQCADRGDGPDPYIRHFVSGIRKIAARDKTVGKNLLAVVMPIGAAKGNLTAVFSPNGTGVLTGDLPEGSFPPFPPGGPGPQNSITSLYLPKGKQKFYYGVNIAEPGKVAVDAVVTGPASAIIQRLNKH